MVNFRIIEELEKIGKGYKDEVLRIESLFFADDAVLLASIIEDAEQVINKMADVGRHYGLEINKS